MSEHEPLETTKSAPKSQLRDLVTVRTVGILIATVLSVYYSLQSTGALPEPGSCGLSQSTQSSKFGDWLYPRLMALAFPQHFSSDVKLVTIASPPVALSVMNNTCEGRSLLTALIKALNRANAKVIAIDKFFSEGSCTQEAVNKSFREGLTQSKAPIVLGQAAHLRQGASVEEDCLVLTNTFNFYPGRPPMLPGTGPEDQDQKVHFGLTRLNEDTVKIPLRWFAFKDNKEASKMGLSLYADQPFDSFSLVAAKEMDDTIAHRRFIQELMTENKHPFGVFSDEIPTWSALDIICTQLKNKAAVKNQWGDCPEIVPPLPDFSGKLALVGELSESDRVPFLGTEKSGLYLQANYIGSLLKETYVKAISRLLDLALLVTLALLYFTSEVRSLVENWSDFKTSAVQAGILFVFCVTGIVLLRFFHLFAPFLFLGFLNFSLVCIASCAAKIAGNLIKHTDKVAVQ